MPGPSVIVISSHVVRGAVGCRAAVFALEALGHPVWAVHTISLPWHPGHGPSASIVPSPVDFATRFEELAGSPRIDEVGAVMTGYMAQASQVETSARFVNTLRQSNPGLIYLCDPVLGDEESLYVPDDVAAAIRDQLVPISDIITPNRFEAGWLVGDKPPDTLSTASEIADKLQPEKVLITSCPTADAGKTGTLLASDETRVAAFHRKLVNPPNGTGDLMAALFLGHVLSGMSELSALRQSAATVYELVKNSVAGNSDELVLAGNMGSVLEPTAHVALNTLDSVAP